MLRAGGFIGGSCDCMNTTTCLRSSDCPANNVCRSDRTCGCPSSKGVTGLRCDEVTIDSVWFLAGTGVALILFLLCLVFLARVVIMELRLPANDTTSASRSFRRLSLAAAISCCVFSIAEGMYSLATMTSIRNYVEYKFLTSGFQTLATASAIVAVLTLALAWIETALKVRTLKVMDATTLQRRRRRLAAATSAFTAVSAAEAALTAALPQSPIYAVWIAILLCVLLPLAALLQWGARSLIALIAASQRASTGASATPADQLHYQKVHQHMLVCCNR